MPFGFPREVRVRKHSEYVQAQKSRVRVNSTHFVFVLASSGNADGKSRLGVAASRRIGNAIVRNRAKRLVREAFRSGRVVLPSGIDVIVILRQSLADMKLADVISEWRHLEAELARKAARIVASSQGDLVL